MMEDIEVLYDKALYLPHFQGIVLSDLHLGVTFSDTAYPVMEHTEIHSRINSLIERTQPRSLVFNGDIFSVSNVDQYWIEMFEDFQSQVEDMIFIMGNHELRNDGYPDFVKRSYDTMKYYKTDQFLIHHGHRTPTVPSETHIIGHLHPTYDSTDILAYGENAYYESDILVLPKFTNILQGADIRSGVPKGHCPTIDDGMELGEYEIINKYQT